MNAERIQFLVIALIVTMLENGLSFEEGVVASRVLTFMMDEIKRDGNIDETFLADTAARLVHEEIGRRI